MIFFCWENLNYNGYPPRSYFIFVATGYRSTEDWAEQVAHKSLHTVNPIHLWRRTDEKFGCYEEIKSEIFEWRIFHRVLTKGSVTTLVLASACSDHTVIGWVKEEWLLDWLMWSQIVLMGFPTILMRNKWRGFLWLNEDGSWPRTSTTAHALQLKCAKCHQRLHLTTYDRVWVQKSNTATLQFPQPVITWIDRLILWPVSDGTRNMIRALLGAIISFKRRAHNLMQSCYCQYYQILGN